MDSTIRNASATIKGYLFQFDATILSILQLNDDDCLTIEGIEDFDVLQSDMTIQYQCKYLEATKLTPSIIREAILPMLTDYLVHKDQRQSQRRYNLYGYFKDSIPAQIAIPLSELKKSLIVRKFVDGNKGQSSILDLQSQLGATDNDLERFLSHFTIHVTDDFDTHKYKVIELLKKTFSVTSLESECYLYPSARAIVSNIAIKKSRQQRTISKKLFLSQLVPSHALYDAWYLREKSEDQYCSTIRSSHFCQRNIDNVSRIFLIDSKLLKSEEEIVTTCYEITSKWSSHKVHRKPNNERYAPFIFIKDISDISMRAIKYRLHEDNLKFIDGYPFLGSKFVFEEICKQQTYENQISLRVISTAADFSEVITKLKGRRTIYHFFEDKPIDTLDGFTQVSIPVISSQMIMKIL